MKRITNMRSFALVTVLLTIMIIFYSTSANAQRTIKVGILDTYSGPPAVYGNDALNGFKLALNDINKKGVLGTKIEFTTRDDKFKVDIGLSMAKELVMMEKVDLIVGTINSAVSLAVSDYLQRGKRYPSSFGFQRLKGSLGRKGIVMFSRRLKIPIWPEKPGDLR